MFIISAKVKSHHFECLFLAFASWKFGAIYYSVSHLNEARLFRMITGNINRAMNEPATSFSRKLQQI